MRPRTCAIVVVLTATLLTWQSPTQAQTTRRTGEQLTTDIRQRDSAERRAKTLAEVWAMLKSNPADQAAALEAIWHTGDIKYDRAGLVEASLPLLKSPDSNVRKMVLGALPVLKADVTCL